MTAFKSIDDYIKTFPESVQAKLKTMRRTIKKSAPGAEEAISYNMPTFRLAGKTLVHFAGYKNHIGFYALPTAHEAFQEQLARYVVGKGSVQFPLDEPLPLPLIRRMVEFRAKEVQNNAQ